MKILLAVDGSRNALNAVDALIANAHWYRSAPEVELVTVHLPVPQVRGLSRVVGRQALKKYYDEEGRANLAHASRRLKGAGIAFTPQILVGQVAESIERHARDRHCDFIMLGTRGMTATANALLGSTATKLLHIARVPVMLVR
jgi:nucleotide-binding universal stress UspA family protein